MRTFSLPNCLLLLAPPPPPRFPREAGARCICPRERQNVGAPTSANPWLPQNFEGEQVHVFFVISVIFWAPEIAETA